jgi:ABC-type bacteriocin/lantibiotic exporter with double-glycine peptidase domain
MALVGLACLALLSFAGYLNLSIRKANQSKNEELYNNLGNSLREALSVFPIVKAFTMESLIKSDYEKQLKERYQNEGLLLYKTIAWFAFSVSAIFLVNMILFYAGGKLILNDGFPVTDFFTIFIAVIFCSMSNSKLFSCLASADEMIYGAKASVDVIRQDKGPDRRPEDLNGIRIDDLGSPGNIKYHDVSLKKETNVVLESANLKIKEKQLTAFVGPPGGGKTTLFKLLLRLEDPDRGKITVGGRDIRELDIQNYRNQIGAVLQNPVLFKMTVQENITLACQKATSKEEVEHLCQRIGIHKVIFNMHLLCLQFKSD